jgi:hypothetical protein
VRTVKCKSGTKGWQGKLQKVYASFEEFVSYCETYNIHKRLGYHSVKKCWEQNPLIKGSVIPSDLQVVK